MGLIVGEVGNRTKICELSAGREAKGVEGPKAAKGPSVVLRIPKAAVGVNIWIVRE